MSEGDAKVRYSATKSDILRQSPTICDKVRYSATKSDILRQSSMVCFGLSGIAVIRWSTSDLIVKEQNFFTPCNGSNECTLPTRQKSAAKG